MSINSDISDFQKETEKLFFKRLANIEQELLSDYKAAQQKIITKLRVLYSKLSVPMGENQLFNASQFNRLNNLEQQINELIKDLNRSTKQNLTKNIKNEFAQGYYSQGYMIEVSTQANLRFGLLNPETISASVANPLNAIKWETRVGVNSAKLAGQIRTEITSGLIQGNGIQETARNISKKFGSQLSNDVERIVRTETMRARSWGNLTGYEQAKGFADKAGIDLHRIWLSTLDSKTRELHVSIDGQPENEDGNFTFSDGVVLSAPRLSGVAEHDIRCRCDAIDIVDNETPKMRLDNEEKKLIPYTKFEDYKANWINKKKSPIKKPVNPLPK